MSDFVNTFGNNGMLTVNLLKIKHKKRVYTIKEGGVGDLPPISLLKGLTRPSNTHG